MQTVIHTKGHLYYRCPGCKSEHSVPVLLNKKEANHWNWNGDSIKPHVRPSVKHTYPDAAYKEHPNLPAFCCHYHITDGNIEYCGDCSHDHSGKTVPMTVFTEQEVKDISNQGG
jgi:hypothetical protein